MGTIGDFRANLLRAELVKRGVRQYQLASALAVPPTKLSSFMTGKLEQAEAASLLLRIEAHLGLTPGALTIKGE